MTTNIECKECIKCYGCTNCYNICCKENLSNIVYLSTIDKYYKITDIKLNMVDVFDKPKK